MLLVATQIIVDDDSKKRLKFKFAFEHKYNVINPSYTIRSHHLHNSNFRTYTSNDRIRGLYLKVNAHKLNHKCIRNIFYNFK